MRPVYVSTCPYCGGKILWGRVQNGHYAPLELKPVPVGAYPPADLYVYRHTYRAFVDLDGTRNAPSMGLPMHYCAERAEAQVMRGVFRIGDVLDELAPTRVHVCPACLVTKPAAPTTDPSGTCPGCPTT